MVRVLQVADKLTIDGSSIHGVTRLFSWWFPAFDRSAFDVRLCSIRGRDKGGEFLEENEVQVHYLNRTRFDPRTLFDLITFIRTENIDILHLHGYGASNFGRLAGLLTGIPTIIHEHMDDQHMPGYQILADRLLSPLSTYSIAVSGTVRNFLVKKRSIPDSKVEIIYNGIPLSAFSNHISKNGKAREIRAHFGIPESKDVVAIIGRLHPVKGHLFFLQAAKRILQTYPEVVFLVVGDGQLLGALQDHANQLGIEAQVLFLGHQEDVPALLSVVDIKVIASLSEGIPMTLFEAMAAGCAVVSTRVGGIPEIITDGQTGLFVPPGDAQMLAEKILLLLKDVELRKTISENARKEALHYEIAETVHRFERLYLDLLERKQEGLRFRLPFKKPGVGLGR